jgi:cytochrome d ubiquinol oxidase subunit I
MNVYTGDSSSRTAAKTQPMKFAAMEGLMEGKTNVGLLAFGILKESENKIGDKALHDFSFKIEFPGLLSALTYCDKNAFIPGITDLVKGNAKYNILSFEDKKARGEVARNALIKYKEEDKNNNKVIKDSLKNVFADANFQNEYFKYFGYASVKKAEDLIPHVPGVFYSFHAMVILGFVFIFIFLTTLILLFKGTIDKARWFLWIALFSIPLPYIASELGWIVTELGRQPWIIQDLMPVSTAVSNITSGSVIATFCIFATLFTALLIAEISIIIKQIKIGPKNKEA